MFHLGLTEFPTKVTGLIQCPMSHLRDQVALTVSSRSSDPQNGLGPGQLSLGVPSNWEPGGNL